MISSTALEIAGGSANGVEIDGVQMPVEKVTHVTFSQNRFPYFLRFVDYGKYDKDILVRFPVGTALFFRLFRASQQVLRLIQPPTQ